MEISETHEWPDWVAWMLASPDTVLLFFSRNAGSAGEPALASPEGRHEKAGRILAALTAKHTPNKPSGD